MRPVRLAELVATPPLATDLGMGRPMEHELRTCLLATGLARELDVADDDAACPCWRSSRSRATRTTCCDGSTAKPLSHVAVRSEDGVVIYDVWESEAVLGDFAQNPRFRAVLQEAGLSEPEVEVTPVDRFDW